MEMAPLLVLCLMVSRPSVRPLGRVLGKLGNSSKENAAAGVLNGTQQIGASVTWIPQVEAYSRQRCWLHTGRHDSQNQGCHDRYATTEQQNFAQEVWFHQVVAVHVPSLEWRQFHCALNLALSVPSRIAPTRIRDNACR